LNFVCLLLENLLESVDTAVSCWATNAAADVTADSLLALEEVRSIPSGLETYHQTAPHTNESTFTPRASSRSQVSVVRIDRQSIDITVGLEMHDSLRLRGSGVKHTALIPERLVQQRGRVRFSDPDDGAGVGAGGVSQATEGAVMFFGGNGKTK
jgi:hypothetical protein